MWAHGMTAVLGIWLLASPDLLGYGGQPRVNNQIVGAWMATLGMIAISECMREVRWVNLVLGLWLMSAPVILDYSNEWAFGSLAAGIIAILLALVRGTLSERFGGGWMVLWKHAES
ncbi:MAG: SPW repeat protein [Nitrospira sp.]|nr:SPW repeat protein [Nitrospira sp.]